jgi:hypothetical protein
MQYFLLGLVVLVCVLVALRGFTRANPGVLARQLRVGAGIVALGVAALLVVRGLVGYAMPLAALGSWLLWGGGSVGGWGRGTPSTGQASRVVTDTLDLTLDHDTGQFSGRVRTGRFAGRELDTLSPAELADLWQSCRFSDPQSARVIEAWLDRTHASWRDDFKRRGHGTGEAGSGGSDRMSIDEACEILGVAADASPDEIRKAHRELMKKLHPDRGGSTYLAAKINEAKDVLLGE